MIQEQFMADNSGKCCDCGESDTLDAMIRKDNIKGFYHCVDCETESYINKLDNVKTFKIKPKSEKSFIKKTILKLVG